MLSFFKPRTAYHKLQTPGSLSIDAMNDDRAQLSSHRKRNTLSSTTVSLTWLGLVIIAFMLGSLLTHYYTRNGECQESDLAWGPAGTLVHRHWHRFDGSFNATSIFKGPPRAELDRAWDRFTENQWIDGTAVVLMATEKELKDSQNAMHAATVADLGKENGGGAMATLEMFHQLHCLNLLRKWTYADYYSTRDQAWTFDRSNSLRLHTDHCIDILRQVLMCNGDMGLVMFHWVEGVGPSPYPDFSTMHQCRDPVAILETAERHAAPIVRPVTKTGAPFELPTFP